MGPTDYLLFSFLFIVVHTVAYHAAGLIALRIGRDAYAGRRSTSR